MSVQIQKKVVKQDTLIPAKAKSLLSDQEQEAVNQIIELEKELAPHRAKLKEYDEKKKFLASVAADEKRFPTDKPAILKTENGFVEFSAPSRPVEITDMHGLIGKLKDKVGGYEKLLAFVKFKISDIKDTLSEAEYTPFTEKVLGSRSLKSVHSNE